MARSDRELIEEISVLREGARDDWRPPASELEENCEINQEENIKEIRG